MLPQTKSVDVTKYLPKSLFFKPDDSRLAKEVENYNAVQAAKYKRFNYAQYIEVFSDGSSVSPALTTLNEKMGSIVSPSIA